MIITYCESCGARVKTEQLEGRILCDACRAGKKPRQRPRMRDSGKIPQRKLDEARAQNSRGLTGQDD